MMVCYGKRHFTEIRYNSCWRIMAEFFFFSFLLITIQNEQSRKSINLSLMACRCFKDFPPPPPYA